MADEDEGYPNLSKIQASKVGKIRPGYSQSNRRNTPYQRPSSSSQGSSAANKGVLNRVAQYVPNWLSSWFTSPSDQSDPCKSEAVSNGPSHVAPSLSPSFREESSLPPIGTDSEVNYPVSRSPEVADAAQLSAVVLPGNKRRKMSYASPSTNMQNSSSLGLEAEGRASDNNLPVSETESENSTLLTATVKPTFPSPRWQPAETLSKPAFKISSFMSSPRTNSFSSSHSKPDFKPALEASSFNFSTSRSPFYVGQTCFGGMSSLRERDSKRLKMSPTAQTVRTTRTQIRAKPFTQTQRTVVTSETAKKILSSLEDMATPLSDSFKRPPYLETTMSITERLRRNSAVADENVNQPPVKSMGVSSTVPVLNLKSSALQSTVRSFSGDSAVTQLSVGKAVPPAENAVSAASKEPCSTPALAVKAHDSNPSALLSSREDAGQMEKVGGKIRREKEKSHYVKSHEQCEVVSSLPHLAAPAPLVVSSLPKFDFVSSAVYRTAPTLTPALKAAKASLFDNIRTCSTSTPVTEARTDSTSSVLDKSRSENERFMFSRPGVIADTTLLDTPNKKGFQFCSPLAVAPNRSGTYSNDTLKFPSDSTERISGKLNLPKPPEGTWNCSLCFVQNEPVSVQCVACQTSKSVVTSTATAFSNEPSASTFPPIHAVNVKSANCSSKECESTVTVSSEAKPSLKLNLPPKPAGSWECPTCMILNKPDLLECPACHTKKPGASAHNVLPLPSDKPLAVEATASFKLKFAKAPGSWDCSTCMITNFPGANACLACGTPKPGAADKIQAEVKPLPKLNLPVKPEGSWSCPMCMIVNDPGKLDCPACGTANPKPAVANPTVTKAAVSEFSERPFGSSSGSFKFGGTGENVTTGFKFETSQSSGFTFGVANGPAEKLETSGFKFGTGLSQSANFSFGTPANASSFQFGPAASKSDISTEIKSSAVAESVAVPSLGFAFSRAGSKGLLPTSLGGLASTSSSEQVFVSSAASGTNVLSVGSSENGPTKVGTFSSIAEAARAGFLTVPGPSKQDYSSMNVANGPGALSDVRKSAAVSLGGNLGNTAFSASASGSGDFKFSGFGASGSSLLFTSIASSANSVPALSESRPDSGAVSQTSGLFPVATTGSATVGSSLFTLNASRPATSALAAVGDVKPALLFGQTEDSSSSKSIFNFATPSAAMFTSEQSVPRFAFTTSQSGFGFGTSSAAPSQATFNFGDTKSGVSGGIFRFGSASAVSATSELKVPMGFNFSAPASRPSFFNGPDTGSKNFDISSKSTGVDVTNNNIAIVPPSFSFGGSTQGLFSLGANPSDGVSGNSGAKRSVLKAHRRSKR